MKIKTAESMPYLTKTGWTKEWHAWDEDTYDGAEDSHCPVGCGTTEREAIDDLVEQIVDPLLHRLSVFIETDWEMKKEIMKLQDKVTSLESAEFLRNLQEKADITSQVLKGAETDAPQPRHDLLISGEGQDSGEDLRARSEAEIEDVTHNAEEPGLGLQGRVQDDEEYDYFADDQAYDAWRERH